MNNSLIIFIKNSIKGKVKTRLAKDLGDDKALKIYTQLLKHTCNISKGIDINKDVYYSKYIEKNDIWSTNIFNKYIQEGKDLGERMANAFQKGFEANNQSICIIGSDCYNLTSQIIEDAFKKLRTHDFVIGPANDGGYYLLGMNQYYPQIFKNKTYSTANVFRETIDEIKKLGNNYFVLPELIDIDNINDLKKMK